MLQENSQKKDFNVHKGGKKKEKTDNKMYKQRGLRQC